MLHHHVSYSHFPQFDRLEQILLNWPKLFEALPVATQPLHVEGDTAIILCMSEAWVDHIREHHDDLMAGDTRQQLARLQPVLAPPRSSFSPR